MKRLLLAMALGSTGIGCEEPSSQSVSNEVGGSGGSASTAGAGGSAGAAGGAGAGGAGGSAGSAGTNDAGVDSSTLDSGPTDAATKSVVLLDMPGTVFTPTASETMMKLACGENGTVYRSVRVEFDLLAGDFQPEIPDEGNPDRTEHILFGLFRDHQTKTDQRYLMGTAAVSWLTKSPHFRMFGRSSIGAGYTTYTSWSSTYLWQKGTLYHVDCLLDGGAKVQTCALLAGGNLEKSHTGDVAYLEPALHLSSGFYVELGRSPPGEIETAPIGWQYSNLHVSATL